MRDEHAIVRRRLTVCWIFGYGVFFDQHYVSPCGLEWRRIIWRSQHQVQAWSCLSTVMPCQPDDPPS